MNTNHTIGLSDFCYTMYISNRAYISL